MTDEETPVEPQPKVASRRKFLGVAGLGAGAVAAVAVPGIAGATRGRSARPQADRNGPDGRPPRPDARAVGPGAPRGAGTGNGPDRFSRMFPRNRMDRAERDQMSDALMELSRPGGILDANDDLSAGPVQLITDPELSLINRDNPTHTAGTTFLGQFLDHDITRDAGSVLGQPTGLRRSVNLRSPQFDLDSVYGGGPDESPGLYEDNGTRLRVESGGLFEDLPRTAEGVAIIGDPRNDEHLIISGLQVAFLLFHNAVIDDVEAGGLRGTAAFEEARRIVRWHYQWIILHEFLPQVVGQDMVNDILGNGRQYFTPDRPTIPVEFQTSAYRFGHSMVRPSYRANLAGDNGEAFFAMVFDPVEFGRDDPNDLTGGHRAPRRFIGWQTFFDFGDGEVKRNKRIDTKMSTPLFRLPSTAIGAGRGEELGPISLATRNLLRHLTWEVPTGQDVAQAMGVTPLSRQDLALFGDFGANLDQRTPLWLYVLREAELLEDGLQLGPVGGRIVAEVFVGLLQMDADSYVGADPTWTPTLTRRNTADFDMVDLLTYAGVDPISRGQ